MQKAEKAKQETEEKKEKLSAEENGCSMDRGFRKI